MASERKYTDMTIEVMEHLSPSETTRTFGANKAVLYRTPYFAAMIDSEETNADWDGVYRIRMMNPRAFAFLLECIYTGAMEPEGSGAIAPDMLASIAVAADMLQLPSLVAACADFVCPRNALVVLKAAARVGTPEMGMLVERCARAIVLGTATAACDPDLDLDPLAFVADGVLPLHAVYAIATQAVLAIGRFSPEETRMIGRVWAAVQARFDGISLCDLQSSLQMDSLRDSDAQPAMLLGPYSKTFAFDLDRASAEHHIQFEATMGEQSVIAIVHDTKNCANDEFACVDIEVRLVPPTIAVDQSTLSSSPRLIAIRTESSNANTGVSVPCGFTDESIPVYDPQVEEELDDPSRPSSQLRFTVELEPLFDLVTAVAVCTLQHDTAEIVARFEISVLCWVLRSPKTVYDPIRVLGASASRATRDRAAIVAALIHRLSDVPVSRLLDLLNQAPCLSRIGDFTKLILEPNRGNHERRHTTRDPRCACAADLCCTRDGAEAGDASDSDTDRDSDRRGSGLTLPPRDRGR